VGHPIFLSPSNQKQRPNPVAQNATRVGHPFEFN
jgi:hypothetical protein